MSYNLTAVSPTTTNIDNASKSIINDNSATTATSVIAALSTELISDSVAKLIETVVQAGILPELVLFGLVANVISMVVFARQGLRDRVNICLFSLAVADNGYLTFLFGSRVYSLLSLASPSVGEYWKWRSLMFVGLYAGFLNVSNVLTLLISLDRCVCVVSPLRAKRILSARATRFLVILVFLVCLGACSPASFKYDVVAYVDPATKATRYKSTLTSFYKRHRDAIEGVFNFGFNVALPTLTLIVVMIATTVIAVKVRQVMAWRHRTTNVTMTSTSSSSDNQLETAVTRMLIVVCVTFTLCTIPTVTLSFARNLVPGFLPSGHYTNAFYVSNCLQHLLSCVNASVNFVIYYVMGSRFRDTFKSVFGVCCGFGRCSKGGREKESFDNGALSANANSVTISSAM